MKHYLRKYNRIRYIAFLIKNFKINVFILSLKSLKCHKISIILVLFLFWHVYFIVALIDNDNNFLKFGHSTFVLLFVFLLVN